MINILSSAARVLRESSRVKTHLGVKSLGVSSQELAGLELRRQGHTPRRGGMACAGNRDQGPPPIGVTVESRVRGGHWEKIVSVE